MISLLSGYGPSVVAGLPPLPRMILPASSVSRLPPLRRPSLRIRSAQSMYSRVMRVNDSGSAVAGDGRWVGRCSSRRKLAMGRLLVWGCGGQRALPCVCRSGHPGTDRPGLFFFYICPAQVLFHDAAFTALPGKIWQGPCAEPFAPWYRPQLAQVLSPASLAVRAFSV